MANHINRFYLFCVVDVIKNVVWLSAGVSSFIAGYLVREIVTDWIYIDVADQHPDSLRFINDCQKAIDKEIIILKSDKYKDVADVVRKTKMINSPHGAPCTGMLKKAVRRKWESEHKGDKLNYIWGMDADEKQRAESIVRNNPEFGHIFPLIEKGLTKKDCHGLIDQLGIKRPLMYDLGYNNNNCIGCVKGGMWYWNKIRRDFPEVFRERTELEREINHSCINGVFLDELDPQAGKKSEELNGDCGVICYLEYLELTKKGGGIDEKG